MALKIYTFGLGGFSGIIDVPGSAFMFQLKKYALPFPKYVFQDGKRTELY